MFVSTPLSRNHRTSLTAMFCALILVISACGSSESAVVESAQSSSATTEEAVPTTSSDDSSNNEGASDNGDSEESESPLGDLLGLPIADDDAMDQYFEDLSRQAEIKIAECMIAQGFEYNVIDYSQLDGAADVVDFDTREFAETYGFGIASNPFEESFEAFESFVDPNQEYLSSLGEGERDAYQTALSGDFSGLGDGDETFEPSGCQGQAYDEAFAFGRVFEQFGAQFEEIEAAFDADPRIVQASSGWSGCMSEAGYGFSDADGAEADVQRRYDAIVRDPDAFADDDDAVFGSDDDGDDGGFVFGPQTLNPEFQAQVDELAVEERAIATASWDCNGPLRDIEADVQREYEQKFVDQNGAAIRAALDEG